MTQYLTILLAIPIMALIGAAPVQAGPVEPAEHPHQASVRAVHEAEHEVDMRGRYITGRP